DDLTGAGKFIISTRRLTDEDSFSAWRFTGANRIERPVDHNRVDAAAGSEQTVYSEVGVRLVNSRSPLTIHQGGADVVRTGRNRYPETPGIPDVDLHAIDCDIRARSPSSSKATTDTELVLGVHWKSVLNEHASARSQRQTFDMTILGETGRRIVGN